ncbi:MAG: SLBB domain-containing protein [Campylobacteraceae bacterium]|nr:SLBB domain-containing protein [Campylobacteraceae bacterium]
MRAILLVCFCAFSLFANPITSEQLKLLKEAGFTKSSVQKKDTPKKQVIENKIENFKLKDSADSREEIEEIVYEAQGDRFIPLDKIEKVAKKKKQLKRFASNFFNNLNAVDPYSVPIPDNYMISRGDVISVDIYGSNNENFSLKVDAKGTINIPQVGELQLLGLNFNEAKELIIQKAKEAYPSNTNILVNMDEFAAIQVTLTGLVKNPGLYNLSSFSTIKDAISKGGGILDSGSYRNILLKRNGEIIKTFDLYSLIKYGSNSSDTVLQSGDIVHVKSSNKSISLSGEVNMPAIYELETNESFQNLISFASGFKAKANKKAIRLKRYTKNNIKVYTLSLQGLYKFTPRDGDEIYVPKISNQSASLVKLSGNVVDEGELEMPRDKKLSTLFKNQFKHFGKNGIFKQGTNFLFAKVENVADSKVFNLKKVLSGEEEVYLKNGDNVIIYKLDDIKDKPFFYVKGDVLVNSKKQYDYYDGLRAKDLFSLIIFDNQQAENEDENLTKNTKEYKILSVDKTKIQIKRAQSNKYKIYTINVQDNPNFLIEPYDEIRFFSISQLNDLKKASIRGEVFIPNTYDITSSTRLKDLISLAGGFTKKASKTTFELVRYKIVGDERKRDIKTIDLNQALKYNMKIMPDDEITIRRIANWYDKQYVEIAGEVKYPGRYAVSKGEKLSSLIERAGGFTDEAFVEGSVFTRAKVKKLQEKRLKEAMARIKRKSLYLSSTATEAGESASDKQRMLASIKELENKIDENAPIGRVSLNLYHDLKRFKQSDFDINLEDKDSLYIPTINDTVSVVGEVLNQNTFVYRNGLSVKDYISRAGGLTDIADEDMIYVVKANGEAIKYEKKFFISDSVEVFKGDTIVVPLKFDTISDIRFAKDVTSILYQLAVTAASLKTVGAF